MSCNQYKLILDIQDCKSMAQSEDPNNQALQFSWGEKRGKGGKNKDCQFYESFMIDNIKYSLYDCVYLYEMGEEEPYIGKIIKIWEQLDHKKKVKILWFFLPNEIQNYLGDLATLEKEIFLACGEGVGLANINPLEAVAGKCSVVCTSQDERNPQPSKKELEMADFIFYRTFDVQSCTISEKIEDRIAGVEAKFLFNRKVDQNPSSVCKLEADGINQHLLAKPDSKSALENKLDFEDIEPQKVIGTLSKSDSDRALENKFDVNLEKASKSLASLHPLPKSDYGRASEKKLDVKPDKFSPFVAEGLPSKKSRLLDDPVKVSRYLNNDVSSKRPKLESKKDDSLKETLRLTRESSDKMKLSERKGIPSEDHIPKASTALDNDNKKPGEQILEVTATDSDRSKWFKGMTWETKLKRADEHETLVFIENLDPSYTSSEVEDIVYNTLKQSCIAKVIPLGSYQNPNYGQAYAIFKTRDAANQAVSRINSGCLLQPNGRPLICSKGKLKVPNPAISGHLPIDKLRPQMQREEMKKAVSTSHCSQPNTIEYEMALNWLLKQEVSNKSFRRLHKRQFDEQKEGKKSLRIM